MHQSLVNIQSQLKSVIAQVRTAIASDEPFSIAHGNWSFPSVSRADLIADAQELVDLIEDAGADEVGEYEPLLTDYVRRLQFLQQHTIANIWGNPQLGVSAYMMTMDGLRRTLAPVMTRDQHRASVATARRVTSQVRGMEARVKELEPRAASIEKMIDAIESAYNAADQLPTDMASLAEAQQKLVDISHDAIANQARIVVAREQADEISAELYKRSMDAEAVLQRCETAYSAATSVGLAAAFSERSKSLANSMWVWVAGLVAALAAGGFFGTQRFQALIDLLKEPNSQSAIYSNIILSLLSVGAPIWFAWLSTKQIGQRFKLAEDYAFKASISRAYEGFRRETARVDKALEARLLASALDRLDELPLRLVETETHGSPWNELANSDIVKQAIKSVPDFASQVRELAGGAVARLRPFKESQNTATNTASVQAAASAPETKA
jgi:hypothetical protein